jgi:NADH-quinone oxidoreductase subunit L
MAHWVFLIPLVPAVSWVVTLLVGKRLGERCAYIGIGAVAASWVMAAITAYQWIDEREIVRESVTWFDAGGALGGEVRVGTHVDGLAVMMLVVVTTVSLLVHVYSLEYLRDDRRFTHYYAALSLFSASMLMLVIADNTLALLTSWELVGLCSYMLISHWWEDKNNADAGLKAFIVNRVGDIGLICGVVVTFWFAGRTFDIQTINRVALDGTVSHGLVLVAACSLLAAVCSKSGQVPLHIWLPDAMAGPTPVSALIHAATMVVAGVYMVARLYGVFFSGFSIDAGGINLLALIGGITMVLGASLAFVQFDVKRVLAYSTISQLGYMVTALGVGAWTAGVFHLFTHAFFKACLFLGAGSLSHACHHTFDMREMGGLRKKLPTTHWTFALGTLALAGVPPLAGFWSKDEILNGARADDYQTLLILGLIAAFMTAAYMGRAYYLIFWGDYRGHAHPHESPRVMTIPVTILAVLAAVVGLLNAPGIEKFSDWVIFETEVENHHAAAAVEGGAVGEEGAVAAEGAEAVEGAAAEGAEAEGEHAEGAEGEHVLVHSIDEIEELPPGEVAVFEPEHHEFNLGVAALSTLVGLAGLLVATWIYGLRRAPKGVLERSTPAKALHTLLVNKYYFDALAVDGVARGTAGPVARGSYWVNQNVIDGAVNGTGVVTKRFLAPFAYDVLDQWVVDGVYNGTGEAVKGVGGLFRRLQTGRIQRYALWLFASVGILTVVVLAVT